MPVTSCRVRPSVSMTRDVMRYTPATILVQEIAMALLDGKVAIITGASKGIGRALSLRFAQENAAVICAARSADLVRETANLVTKAGARARPAGNPRQRRGAWRRRGRPHRPRHRRTGTGARRQRGGDATEHARALTAQAHDDGG